MNFLFPILGCAVCFSDPGSTLTQSVSGAILTLLVITCAVLGGFVWFIIGLRKRESQLSEISERFNRLAEQTPDVFEKQS